MSHLPKLTLDWLPAHKCGLYLTHNEHRDVYESVDDFYRAEDFVSPEAFARAFATDEVWSLQWYPDTPIGSYTICAPTLGELIEAVKEHGND